MQGEAHGWICTIGVVGTLAGGCTGELGKDEGTTSGSVFDGNAAPQDVPVGKISVAWRHELPRCNHARQGAVAYIESEDKLVACLDHHWEEVPLKVGPPGPKGAPGASGPQGPIGELGAAGPAGSDGHDSLLRIIAEPPGDNCRDGGQKIEVGTDVDDNGVLDDGEVQSTAYICNSTGAQQNDGGTPDGSAPDSDGGGDAALICPLSTTLEDLVMCMQSHMPGASSNRVVIPNAIELEDWRWTVTQMLQKKCEFPLPASLASTMVLRTMHDAEVDKDFCVLMENRDDAEDGIVDHGWGTFVVNPMATQELSQQAPHVISDNNTAIQAATIFKHTNSRNFLMAGAPRDTNVTTSQCQLSSSDSDAARNTALMFHATNEAMFTFYADNPWYVLQWHGMATTTCAAEVFMTYGVTTSPAQTDKIVELRNSMLKYHPTWCIEVPGTPCAATICNQYAATNTQGRLLNGVATGNVCDKSSSSYSGRYFSIEQDPNNRAPSDWISAIGEVWP